MRGSVSDGTSENKGEWKRGSVRGDDDQEKRASGERPRHQGRFKNSIEGIGSVGIARGVT